MREYSFVVPEFRCREMLYFTVDGVISGGRINSPQQKGNNDISLPFCPSRDQEWQPKEHPGSLLHPVTLQAATAATAAVLPIPGGAQPADQQQHNVRQQPQDTRDAVQVYCNIVSFQMCSVGLGLIWSRQSLESKCIPPFLTY